MLRRISGHALIKWTGFQAARITLRILTQYYPDLVETPLSHICARLAPARHSADFRSVRWFGKDFSFSAGQAIIVQQLWTAWQNGTRRVSKAVLLETADLAGESVKDVLKRNEAWGMMIQTDNKGAYWLQEPEEEMPELKTPKDP